MAQSFNHNTLPVIKEASYFLAHVPNLVRHGSIQLDDTVEEQGYVVYKDYIDYMERRKQQEQLDLNWGIGRVRYEIRNTLLSKGWMASRGHPETRFYPPSCRGKCPGLTVSKTCHSDAFIEHDGMCEYARPEVSSVCTDAVDWTCS